MIETKEFIIAKKYSDIQLGDYYIVYHKDTKVMYVVTSYCKNNVFTLLVNPDGTPMLWDDSKK